ncbi:hypothetical protein [Amycolatopsis sp. CA-230715]|uniref:hypothetical protein n=1 Tax=Amycolatopsis sp. CA-230715 TaxID=2745196 RepID=UPI001C012E40|nr:hypothetical protein [Amycolatopsis sp. CA-230715]QWF80543.1 hypothetical protein HUW46_03966 [Amycolatopsis sp. CA-230715]
MQGRTRRTVATGATVFVLAGSAVLGAPATASASTVVPAQCGQTVTVHPGDKVQTPFGLKTITDLIGGVLDALCHITVNVVDAVVAPVPVIGAPAAGAINGVVSGTTNGLGKAAGDVGKALSGGGQPPKQGTPPPAQQPPKQGTPGGAPGAPATGGGAGSALPPVNSPLVPGAGAPLSFGGLPVSFAGGYSPMRDYSNVPVATAGLYTPSPGVRYGGQVPGYAPEFGILGQDGPKQPNGVQNAGRAEALPSGSSGLPGGVGLPVLLAVVALSGASAGLVRTWVLRKTVA